MRETTLACPPHMTGFIANRIVVLCIEHLLRMGGLISNGWWF